MGQLEYIYNTETNARFYNNFNITVDNNSEVEMQFRVLNPNTIWDGRLFLIGTSYHDCYAQFQQYNVIRCGFQSFAEKTIVLQDTSAIHTVNVSANGYYVDGVSLGTLSGTPSVSGNGFSINTQRNMLLEIYYITVKDSGVLSHNYLPWDNNGVVGLMDVIEDTFYAPTTGVFYGQPLPATNIQVPINKYKLGVDNIQKTYEGGTKINKMYVGSNLVYRALPTTTPTPTPTLVDYVHTSTPSLTANYIDTGVYPTVNTTLRIVYKPNAKIDSTLVGFYAGSTPTRCSSDSTDYRYFYHRGLDDVTFDFNSSRFYKTITFDADGYADITVGNNYITDNITQSTATGGTQSSVETQNVPIYLNVSSDLDFRSLEIWENNVKVYDGHAAVLNGTYGVYDSVVGTFTTQTYGGNTMSGGNIS